MKRALYTIGVALLVSNDLQACRFLRNRHQACEAPSRPVAVSCQSKQISFKDSKGQTHYFLVWESTDGKVYFPPSIEPAEIRYYSWIFNGKRHQERQLTGEALYDVDVKRTSTHDEAFRYLGQIYRGRKIVDLLEEGHLSLNSIGEKMNGEVGKLGAKRFTLSFPPGSAEATVNESLLTGPGGILLEADYKIPCPAIDRKQSHRVPRLQLRSSDGKTKMGLHTYVLSSVFTVPESEEIGRLAKEIGFPREKYQDLTPKEMDALKKLFAIQARHLPDGMRQAFCSFFQRDCRKVAWQDIIDEVTKDPKVFLSRTGFQLYLGGVGADSTPENWARNIRMLGAYPFERAMYDYLWANLWNGIGKEPTLEERELWLKRCTSLNCADGVAINPDSLNELRSDLRGRVGSRFTTEPPFAAYRHKQSEAPTNSLNVQAGESDVFLKTTQKFGAAALDALKPSLEEFRPVYSK